MTDIHYQARVYRDVAAFGTPMPNRVLWDQVYRARRAWGARRTSNLPVWRYAEPHASPYPTALDVLTSGPLV